MYVVSSLSLAEFKRRLEKHRREVLKGGAVLSRAVFLHSVP